MNKKKEVVIPGKGKKKKRFAQTEVKKNLPNPGLS
jgi:hypothetical protein